MTCAITRRWSVMRMPFLAHSSSRVSVWPGFSIRTLLQWSGHHQGRRRLAIGPRIISLALGQLLEAQPLVELDRRRIVGRDLEDHALGWRHQQILETRLQ